jgi:hypothetical protein
MKINMLASEVDLYEEISNEEYINEYENMNSMVDETNLIRILRENHIKSKI